MSETSSVRSPLVRKLKRIDAQPIESPMKGGVPDVNHRFGWIECKYKPQWTRNCDKSPVKFPHPLTKGQKVWIRRRVRAGGSVSVCAKVRMDWFFFDCSTWELNRFNCMTRPEMMEECGLHFNTRMDVEVLIKWLASI